MHSHTRIQSQLRSLINTHNAYIERSYSSVNSTFVNVLLRTSSTPTFGPLFLCGARSVACEHCPGKDYDRRCIKEASALDGGGDIAHYMLHAYFWVAAANCVYPQSTLGIDVWYIFERDKWHFFICQTNILRVQSHTQTRTHENADTCVIST